MPSFEEKQRRKAIQDRLREEAKTTQLAELPIPKKTLALYFDYLDQQLSAHGCDDTLRFTQQFSIDQKVEFDAVKHWLSKYGGYCDCEALANVEDQLDKL